MSQTRYAILGMLTLGPMSGYDLKKVSERSLAHFWHESYGNLYPRLAELEADGLVTTHRERKPGRPEATVYTLTGRGREEFERWLEDPPGAERVRSELLLKLFFGAHAPPDVVLAHLARYRREQETLRETFAAIEQRLGPDESVDAVFWRMTLRRGQLLNEARLRWCEESLAAVEAITEKSAAAD